MSTSIRVRSIIWVHSATSRRFPGQREGLYKILYSFSFELPVRTKAQRHGCSIPVEQSDVETFYYVTPQVAVM
jgi:hypothetical protein